jgi:tartrate dehydrogenase/decarboxylase/D-malate dehydrogenase
MPVKISASEFLLSGKAMKEHKIAVIPGDGIGREVIPEGVRVLEAVGAKHGLRFKWQEFPWSCDWYKAHGRMCPDDAADILRKFDAVYFGAVGNPALVPDHIAVWGLLINFRRWFDLYVNLRPVRLFEGMPCPLAGRKPGDIDYFVIRENTEGEYGNVGGRIFENTPNEMAMQQAIFSRRGTDRIMKYAFELARTRKKHLTSATKSNGISITMPYWDERFAEMGKQYPDVKTDQYHVDGLTIQMVLNPDRFDVIVASNLFGDILSDLGPATAGTIGIAASGNINPERTAPSIFEPVHGSAPDIAGRKIANPLATIWSGALMLEHLGHPEAAADILRAIERVIVEGPHTPDMKGKASTADVGAAVAEAIRSQSRKAA